MFKLWFMGGPEIDAEITDKFKSTLLEIPTKKDAWMTDHSGRLSLILVCD